MNNTIQWTVSFPTVWSEKRKCVNGLWWRFRLFGASDLNLWGRVYKLSTSICLQNYTTQNCQWMLECTYNYYYRILQTKDSFYTGSDVRLSDISIGSFNFFYIFRVRFDAGSSIDATPFAILLGVYGNFSSLHLFTMCTSNSTPSLCARKE